MTVELHVVDTLAEPAAAAIVALDPRTMAPGGGSTPRSVYERLAAAPLPWHAIDVFFGDERCVPPDHPDSNERMARQALLAHVPARAYPMPGATCDAAAYEHTLTTVLGAGVPRLDVAILGLGEDGHTASLFPGDPVLEERTRLVMPVRRADHTRLTLTLPVLSAARVALFLVAGAAKREPLRRLLDGDTAIAAERVAAERVIVFADREAAPLRD